jgi:hypothetical protein
MDLVTRLLMVSALALPVISAKPTFEKSGVVIIPRADCRADGGKLSAGFRATRWGMYDLMIEGTADAGLKAMLNGQGPVAAGSRPGHLGSYYMEKAGPCVIELNGTAGEKGKAIELDARDCRISGVMLRYEPKPKKLCIGFWGNPEDYPVWNYTVVTPGRYEVVLTQGCGRGAGGSKAVLETAGTSLEFTVKDTGGYQNWIDVSLGEVTFAEAGSQQLSVKVLKKARGIMDIRRIVLKPVK